MEERNRFLNIRPARKEDYPKVAPLIIAAMEDLACSFANTSDPKQAIPLFERFFQLSDNQYSYENTLVFESEDGVIGSVIGYDGKELRNLRKPFLDYISEIHNVHTNLVDEATMDEFYIDTISVLPTYRGKGVGSKLLLAIIEHAHKEGHRKIGLLVDKKNPSARNLYSALGFKVVDEKNLCGTVYDHMQFSL